MAICIVIDDPGRTPEQRQRIPAHVGGSRARSAGRVPPGGPPRQPYEALTARPAGKCGKTSAVPEGLQRSQADDDEGQLSFDLVP